MRKFAFLAMLVISLTGCATTPSNFGNFTQNAPAAFNQTMVDDAVTQLVILYPPAITSLDLQHSTSDAFGSALVESLRLKGYAILEFNKSGTATASTTGSTSQPLRYVLDQSESTLYRITVLVGKQSLSRAYLAGKNGTLHPAGAWVRKE